MKRGAFNPGQRFWYIYVPIALIAFAVTGAIKWLGPDVVGQQTVDAATAVHVSLALATDPPPLSTPDSGRVVSGGPWGVCPMYIAASLP